MSRSLQQQPSPKGPKWITCRKTVAESIIFSFGRLNRRHITWLMMILSRKKWLALITAKRPFLLPNNSLPFTLALICFNFFFPFFIFLKTSCTVCNGKTVSLFLRSDKPLGDPESAVLFSLNFIEYWESIGKNQFGTLVAVQFKRFDLVDPAELNSFAFRTRFYDDV
jgi:hypothetical protein